jgi:catechol 2,3-dioxygenase-like lactoylglutathione lyase family enzyme
MRVTGLDHIVLNIDDVERSLRFGSDELALDPRFGARGDTTAIFIGDPDG